VAHIAQAECFRTDAHRDAVINAITELDEWVDVWAVHYLESDDKTRLLCFLLIREEGLHMGVLCV
jgi:hypothetical protein